MGPRAPALRRASPARGARAGARRERDPHLRPGRLTLTRRIFLAALGVAYLCAFASLWVQVDGLIGDDGILPASELLDAARARAGPERFWRIPTLLWLADGAGALHLLCGLGVLASLVLIAGFASLPCLALLFIAYLSLASVGGTFLGYQWDALLLEAGALAILLAPLAMRPGAARAEPIRRIPLFMLRWLLFRLMFLSGAVKLLSGDPTWRGLTALDFHYFTQPLPVWTSWYLQQLPHFVHAGAVLGTLAIELGAPLLVFGPRRARQVAFALLVGLQLAIAASGNYGFFNVLTLALCVLLLDDRALLAALPRRLRERWSGAAAPEEPRRRADARVVAMAALAVVLVGLSGFRTLETLGLVRTRPAPIGAVLRLLGPLRLTSSYGLFAVMTTERPEIVVEGSVDGSAWRTYAFRWKPGELDRRPRFAPGHMPRLDWQMWFAALRGCGGAPWFQRFMQKLLEAEPTVLALLEEDPFPGERPRYLRSTVYSYEFSGFGDGPVWWVRVERGAFCPTVALRDGRLVRVR